MTTRRTAAILAIGDELTIGQKLDTNSQRIAAALTDFGVVVQEHATEPDDLQRMVACLGRLARDTDLLIITGGLGPTADDLTRQALAAALDESLVEDAAALAEIESWYRGRGRAMPPANRVQAMRPASARMLSNPNGTAPGLAATVGGCAVYCLPGPPREMVPMFERDILGPIASSVTSPVSTKILYTLGKGESDIAGLLGELMDRDRDPLVGTTASQGVVSVRIRSEQPRERAMVAVDCDATEVRARLGDCVFSEEQDLAPYLLERLAALGQTVGTVESCTGGLVAGALTAIPGSSAVVMGGLVTYSNAMKTALAGVPAAVIEEYGAVSKACAVAMAEGGRAKLGTTHALAITGVAGPDGGTASKPVGTVWIALASDVCPTDARLFQFLGNREAVRGWSITSALGLLRLRLDRVEMSLLGERPS